MKNASLGFRARLILAAFALGFCAQAASPSPCEGIKDFESYEKAAEQSMREAPWPKFSSELQQGRPVVKAKECNDTSLTEGMVHHYSGRIFLKGQSLRSVIALLQDYDNRREYFRGDVLESAIDCLDGQEFKIYMRLKKSIPIVGKIAITRAFDTDNKVTWDIHEHSASSQSRSLRICQVALKDPRSKEATCRTSEYFLRLNSFWRYKESDGGVHIQGETITLSTRLTVTRGKADQINSDSLERTLTGIQEALNSGKVPKPPTGKPCTAVPHMDTDR